MKFNSLFALAITATFVACSNDNDPKPISYGEMKLTNSIKELAVMRSTGDLTTIQDTKILANQAVGIFIDEIVSDGQNVSTPLQYTNEQLTAGADGMLTPTGDGIYFPITGNSVSIYAYQPYNAAWNDKETAQQFAVQSTQNTEASIANSDLLYGNIASVSNTGSTTDIKFGHKLTKIIYSFTAGTGFNADDLNSATITIKNTKLKTSVIVKGGNMTDITADNDATDIIVKSETDTHLTGSAIIIPQTVAAGTQFMEVALKSGGKLYFKLDAEKVFAGGYKYTYNITVNPSGLTLSSSQVDGWNDGGSDNGTAEM
ncbi:fimbrillin family protein [Coprobacter tertius]|uniref:Fimbrillin family protein n=1 Tax=Coprobacter tertius TaxID=2944915 RepID=A0ABT1MM26_9BACT|nr:fimbrillin family protein [Coprobacter tertius]MCP9612788.1 fimbrillin family protein [Coprobacter tertius]